MRKLLSARQLALCLVAVVAACSSPAENEVAAGDNAAAANEEAANAGAAADANAAEPSAAGNEANASANAAAASGDDAITFRASGTEPFWTLTMGTQMVYDSADGPDVTATTPPGRSTRTGPVYATPEMEVWINQVGRCEDASGKSGMRVRVTIGTQVVNGCGSGAFPD